MSAISKFNSALLSMPNELTVAAANFNINFSLMKVEAPKEYHGLRDALSTNRRREAEEGLPHVTARTLGALFEAIIPPIPNLTQAYGKRVSEISGTVQPDSKSYLHAGMFANQLGPDGTSIWAAATSGKGAIAVHLLACMLARIWKGPEAISLWVELVERRKKEIHEAFNAANIAETAAMMAAQQIFSRQQLASWDSSARSWLQTADSAKRLQQTQLMLIVNNVRLPVNASKDPYKSVLDAWKSALTTMESVVCGIPQRVTKGDILLAVSAWHLYPDLKVLSDEIKDVEQNDELTQGSVLTISSTGNSNSQEGVFWSLPLSRMRYYSPPVMAERRLASDTSRITMEEFHIVFLGAIISQWQGWCSDPERCCTLIVRLSECLDDEYPPLFDMFASAAKKVIKSKGLMKLQNLKLLKLGIRRCKTFFNDSAEHPSEAFGLNNGGILLSVISNSESRVAFLRQVAERLRLKPSSSIIKYYPTSGEEEHEPFAFASTIPLKRRGSEGPIDDHSEAASSHRRWIQGRPSSPENHAVANCDCPRPIKNLERTNHGTSSNCEISANSKIPVADEDSPDHEVIDLSRESHTFFVCLTSCAAKNDYIGCYNRAIQQRHLPEECHLMQRNTKPIWKEKIALKFSGVTSFTDYQLLFGRFGRAALYVTTQSASQFTDPLEPTIHKAIIDEVEAALDSGSINPRSLREQIYSWLDIHCGDAFRNHRASFLALTFATSLYANMPGATINLEVMNLSLFQAAWAGDEFKDDYVYMDLSDTSRSQDISTDTLGERVARALSCIAWFESGEFDFKNRNLREVMALSTGDSIYVATALITDPSTNTYERPITRVFGNIDRPEMSLLISPPDPMMEKVKAGAWNLINHEEFDGTFQNCFASTSLHLRFTDFEMSMDVGQRGLRDRQAVLVEAIVSIDDRGEHIGDLDILSIFDGKYFRVVDHCSHSVTAEADLTDDLVSLDCWAEFLDPPKSIGIFRAQGNWEARLAAAAATAQAKRKVLVLPENACLKCLDSICYDDVVIA